MKYKGLAVKKVCKNSEIGIDDIRQGFCEASLLCRTKLISGCFKCLYFSKNHEHFKEWLLEKLK